MDEVVYIDIGDRPVEVVFGLLPNCPRLDIVLSSEILRFANVVSGKPRFSWRLASNDTSPITLSDQGTITPDISLVDVQRADVVLMIGGHPPDAEIAEQFSRWLRRLDRDGALLGGVDWGVVLLADSGLLRGYEISAHWETVARLSELNEGFHLNDSLYTFDRRRITGAGRASLLEIMLFIIGLYCGHDIAIATGQELIYSTPRPRESPQRLPRGVSSVAVDKRLRACLSLMQESLENPLSIEKLCEEVGVSSRYLQRLASRELGVSLMSFYLLLRLSKARDLLLHTSMPVLEVATATGFSSSAVFARAFRRHFGTAASKYRTDYLRSRLRPFDNLVARSMTSRRKDQ